MADYMSPPRIQFMGNKMAALGLLAERVPAQSSSSEKNKMASFHDTGVFTNVKNGQLLKMITSYTRCCGEAVQCKFTREEVQEFMQAQEDMQAEEDLREFMQAKEDMQAEEDLREFMQAREDVQEFLQAQAEAKARMEESARATREEAVVEIVEYKKGGEAFGTGVVNGTAAETIDGKICLEYVAETETMVEIVAEPGKVVEVVDKPEPVVEIVAETETMVEIVVEPEKVVEVVDKPEAVVEFVEDKNWVCELIQKNFKKMEKYVRWRDRKIWSFEHLDKGKEKAGNHEWEGQKEIEDGLHWNCGEGMV